MTIDSKLPHAGTTIFAVMSALANEHKAVNLGQGFPDFAMSEELVSLVNEAMKKGFKQLKAEGYNVDVVSPQGAIYLTIKVDLVGKAATDGKLLNTQEEVSAYILSEAKLAVVPFFAFGSGKNSPWYRLSVGTCKKEEIEEMFGMMRGALSKLK